MKTTKLLITITLVLTTMMLNAQDWHFYTTTSAVHASRDISTYGKITLTDNTYNLGFLADLGIYKDDNIYLELSNNAGKLQIGVADCNGCFETTAKRGDVVSRVFPVDGNSDDYIFSLGSGDSAYRVLSNSNKNVFNVYGNNKVTIGTRSYDNDDYNLYVLNGIKTEKIKVEVASANGWADYVFDKDYSLLRLDKLQGFINKNNHLPEVPTATEVVENGVELKEMSVLLLKKVEELTLYILEQEKRLKDLETKINQ